LIGATAAAVVLAVAATAAALLIPDRSGSPPVSGDLGNGEFMASPWRLVVRDVMEGEDAGCTVTLTNAETGNVVARAEGIYGEKSFQIQQAGTFRWEVNDPGCLVINRSGPGNAVLPRAWPAYNGDTDAFKAPDVIAVMAKPGPDWTSDWQCPFYLHDAESGQLVNFGTATEDANPLVLDTEGRSQVYLADLPCDVRVSAG
jgi:hypothetical protein